MLVWDEALAAVPKPLFEVPPTCEGLPPFWSLGALAALAGLEGVLDALAAACEPPGPLEEAVVELDLFPVTPLMLFFDVVLPP
jgi:hypothetical protein